MRRGVETYELRYRTPGGPERVRYCCGCARYAKANMPREMRSMRVVTEAGAK